MEVNGRCFLSVTDEKTGATSIIRDLQDDYSMNWVIENSLWGIPYGFEAVSVTGNNNKVYVICENKSAGLRLHILKSEEDGKYTEEYTVENIKDEDFVLTKDNFAFPFPYSCNFRQSDKVLNQRCISHIWCGGDCTYIYSVKPNGTRYLNMTLVNGSIDDYSIEYDVTRVNIGAFYRGEFALHPAGCVIAPFEKKTYKFEFEFSDCVPKEAAIYFNADKYSLFAGEKVNITFKSKCSFESIKLYSGENLVSEASCSNKLVYTASFNDIGEKAFFVKADGKETWLYLNVLPDISGILKKRAAFIAEKQQYSEPGSPLDGAYLIYDYEEKKTCYHGGEHDHNACRERIGMGVLVCKALQKEYSEKLFASLKKHREFIEREIFDTKSFTVANGINHSCNHNRIYNYPWLSVYYLEWYKLTRERKCLEYSVNIMFKFFEIAPFRSIAQCIEAVALSNALKKENMLVEKTLFEQKFTEYAKAIDISEFFVDETSWCNEIANCGLSYKSQAYILTKDESFLHQAEAFERMTKAFFCEQPDYRINSVSVRYWDAFWFGKTKSYGDLFPHYWSALSSWALDFYGKAKNDNSNKDIIKSTLLANLCVFADDGFAYNNYLYPYRIHLYSSDPNYHNVCMMPSVNYGRKYDMWANDQDWALYYAVNILQDI